VKNYGEHKLEQDNIMDDFKKEVTDNKDSFKKAAPFSVEKSQEFDNEKAMEKLQEFKVACLELR
jgi:dynein heavy chain, axonemal